MATETPKPNIYTAIAAVMAEVGYVQKTGQVDSRSGGYNFAGEADLIHALRPEMLKQGIVMSVAEIPTEAITHETYETKGGTSMNRVTIKMAVCFTHVPSGTTLEVEAIGEGSDVGDKATPKAATGAYKYALRQTFCIETGDDPDEESSEGQERQRPARPDPRQQMVQPAPIQEPPPDMDFEQPTGAPATRAELDAAGMSPKGTCPNPKHHNIKQHIPKGGPNRGIEVYYCATNDGTRKDPQWCNYEETVEATA